MGPVDRIRFPCELFESHWLELSETRLCGPFFETKTGSLYEPTFCDDRESRRVCAGDVHKTRPSLFLTFTSICHCCTVGEAAGQLILKLPARQILAPWRSPRRGSGCKGGGLAGQLKWVPYAFAKSFLSERPGTTPGTKSGSKNETKIGVKKRDQKWIPR